jgi:small subunit ribosomal protein S8
MSMTDPIADMLTRIRNAQLSRHQSVKIPLSQIKKSIADILVSEGYVASAVVEGEGISQVIEIELKYGSGQKPVIQMLKRESVPGCRVYVSSGEIPEVLGGMGLSILSTSRGVLSGLQAKKQGIGGELLCTVY